MQFKISSNLLYNLHANSDVTANRCSVFHAVVKSFQIALYKLSPVVLLFCISK